MARARARKKTTPKKPVVDQIVASARDIHGRIAARRKPSLKFPLRSLSDVRYGAREGHFEMPGESSRRLRSST